MFRRSFSLRRIFNGDIGEGQVIGTPFPSFSNNFNPRSSEVLTLYRNFWRLVYQYPPSERYDLMFRLRNEFRSKRYIRGVELHKAIRKGHNMFKHFRGKVEEQAMKQQNLSMVGQKLFKPKLLSHRASPGKEDFPDVAVERHGSAFNPPVVLSSPSAEASRRVLSNSAFAKAHQFHPSRRGDLKKVRTEVLMNRVHLRDDLQTQLSQSVDNGIALRKDLPSDLLLQRLSNKMNHVLPNLNVKGSVQLREDYAQFSVDASGGYLKNVAGGHRRSLSKMYYAGRVGGRSHK
jgi:hypothetical protein